MHEVPLRPGCPTSAGCRRLSEVVTRSFTAMETALTNALDQVKSNLATYREDARETEVENIAIVN